MKLECRELGKKLLSRLATREMPSKFDFIKDPGLRGEMALEKMFEFRHFGCLDRNSYLNPK